MNNNTSVTVRIDQETKAKAQQILSEMGLDLSTAINLFLRQTVRNQAIPFEITLCVPNAVTEKAMADVANGVGMHGPFHSVDALMEDLRA